MINEENENLDIRYSGTEYDMYLIQMKKELEWEELREKINEENKNESNE
jgi:hypothetical protein